MPPAGAVVGFHLAADRPSVGVGHLGVQAFEDEHALLDRRHGPGTLDLVPHQEDPPLAHRLVDARSLIRIKAGHDLLEELGTGVRAHRYHPSIACSRLSTPSTAAQRER